MSGRVQTSRSSALAVRVLTSPYQRASGAMFHPRLEEKVLAFAYPVAARRIFLTWFCPPLRILCFEDDGGLIENRVITRWQFVPLPRTRLVVELDAEFDGRGLIAEIGRLGSDDWIARHAHQDLLREAGGTPMEDPYGELLLGLIGDSMAQLRSVKDLVLGKEKAPELFQDLPPWRKGQILGAASFVIDFAGDLPYRIPSSALELSRCLIESADENTQAELLAASVAGLPWEFNQVNCFRCGRKGAWRIWRQVLKPSAGIPRAAEWRLARPENHVPLCWNCIEVVPFDDRDLAIAFGYAYWGSRFEALHRWFEETRSNSLPADWNMEAYPLWPENYGGNTWAAGSGGILHCAPRLGKVQRKMEHIQILEEALRHRGFRPHRLSPEGELHSVLQAGHS